MGKVTLPIILFWFCVLCFVNCYVSLDSNFFKNGDLFRSRRSPIDEAKFSKTSIPSNSKPRFKNCGRYTPSVPEEKDKGHPVITVQAEDDDPPEAGGTLTYSLVTAPGEQTRFTINNVTGEIKTNWVFDRDEPRREKVAYIAVRATDNGRPPLDDVCSIKIVIEDINDNSPIFDRASYQESVVKDLKVGKEVLIISASDIDDGINSVISYMLMAQQDASDMDYFNIDENAGLIVLKKSIDKNVSYEFNMRARAEDHGHPSRPTDVDVRITVVGSNKKAPEFLLPLPRYISVSEDHADFTTALITLKATSNIPGDLPVFKLMPGRSEQTNLDNTFLLQQENDTAYLKLAKRLDYERVNEYLLTVEIENKDNIKAQHKFQVRVEDVNDIIPAFIDVATGSVLENEPPGTPVMQVQAIDADGTSANNQVTYELEDVPEIMQKFQIDKHTGNITTREKFDREEKDFYNIKVIAKDSSPSALLHNNLPNKGEQTFRIEIKDVNDNRPRFTKKMYVFDNIAENANKHEVVGEVKAEDRDSASLVTYSIIRGNDDDAFAIVNTTGKISVFGSLDFEKTKEYMLTVLAYDGAFKDEANVTIKIMNVNDNLPVFYDFNNSAVIQEESVPENCITTVKAYDPDIADRTADQHIVYFVLKDDLKDKLKIDRDGCLKLTKSLDRDPPNGHEEWQVIITAYDEDGGKDSLSQTAELNIHLTDINDNAPFLDMVQPVIWTENQEPGKITELTAKDYDSEKNGPPFKFAFDRSVSLEIRQKFSISGNHLYANETFDREAKKEYYIPIEITDSGIPPLSNTSILRLVIGDVNDNKMKSGESSIFVYNYKGMAPDTAIGRVYVDDPDDWDLGDKRFSWKTEHPNFELDTQTGMITMLRGTLNNTYRLEFIVTEKSDYFEEHSVEAVVDVTVKLLPEEAVDKSGSIRFSGISAEEFIAPENNQSKRKLLISYLASVLNVSEENVDVFTVLHSPHADSKYLDVRFSAHGSPYFHPEKLNSIVAQNGEQLEKMLGVEVLMINIDECIIEKVSCNDLSCINFLNKSEKPYSVYTNTSSFVGVQAIVDPVCSCELPQIDCLNGGTPLRDRCECSPGFEGPFCELLSIGFQGNGWALYPPFSACKEAFLSLDITSFKESGLVFYVGPVRRNPNLNVQDFMSLDLEEGHPRLLMDYGSGTAMIKYDQFLSDGKTHHIDIYWTTTSIEMKVDNCHSSSCQKINHPVKPNEFLNVNGPLQLGGAFIDLSILSREMFWNFTPSDEHFSGCIRNLTFNGKTYNLGMPSHFQNVDPGCNAGLAKAVSFGIDTNFLVAILVCIAILLILLLAVVVHQRKTDDMFKDTDDIRENIINYEDEGGGEGDMTGYDLNVFQSMFDNQEKPLIKENLQNKAPDEVPDICGFLNDKKNVCDNDPETNPFDDVRHYAYEGDGNTTGSLSSLASGTDEGDLNFDYLSNFGPRFRKLADMYGEEPSDEEETFQNPASESWC